MERSPYDQAHGLPTSQPYPPIPDHTPTTLGGPPPNPYPQYSYDIHMRYADDPNRSYSQDSNPGPPPQEVPRQYTSMNSPYARDTSKDGPTSPYPKDILSPYSRDTPTSPVASSYPREMPTSPYPPIPTHYSQMPVQQHQGQGQGQGHPVQLPPMSMAMQGHPQDYNAPPQMVLDTTGQIAPGGMKPRVTATLWEDEGTLCFQVDVKGTCVARREDNHMVNGTKLLNVAGMTRGRRDGILKAEKQKHVVKIGPMHLKGVWIPYERALAFANKENITPLLYPLFVHNIGALLYHPSNIGRAGQGYNPASHLSRRQDENTQPQPPQQHQQQQQQSPGMQQESVMFNTARER